MKKGLPNTYDHCKIGRLSIDRHLCKQVGVSCERGCPTDADNLASFRDDENDTNVRVLEDVEKRVPAVVAEAVRYRQRMFVENLDEARRVPFGRGVHDPGRIDA